MPRSFLRRFTAALSGAWLIVALVEPAGVYGCPMHGAAARGVAPQASAVANPEGVDTGAGGEHAHHAPDAPDAPSNHHDGGCLCISDCSGASGAVVTSQLVPLLSWAELPAGPLPEIPAYAPISRGGLVLPFANGPPVLT
jgi:hypothetical protein